MRMSRLRLRDLFRLLTFQYPVRCHACLQRYFVFLPVALRLPGGRTRRNMETSAAGE
jgi:hypothetical protein